MVHGRLLRAPRRHPCPRARDPGQRRRPQPSGAPAAHDARPAPRSRYPARAALRAPDPTPHGRSPSTPASPFCLDGALAGPVSARPCHAATLDPPPQPQLGNH